PRWCITAHAAAIEPPPFVPSTPDDPYMPPSQLSVTKVWYPRSSLFRCMITDAPFAVYPYLCRSTEMLVTPGTEKFQGGTVSPSLAMEVSVPPPMQASTWQLMSRRAASAAISGIGSITPCGYCGADPTSNTVLSSMAASIAAASARQSAPTSTRRLSTPK